MFACVRVCSNKSKIDLASGELRARFYALPSVEIFEAKPQ